MKYKKTTIFIGILDLCAIIGLAIVYLVPDFKNWWITTAIGTGSHKYFAQGFYNIKDINQVLKNNQIFEIDEEVNLDDIAFDNKDTNSYESIYEEQILKRDENNDLYKLIEINEKDYKGYLVAIYDPARISLATADRSGKTASDIAKENDAVVAINASGLNFSTGKANGVVIKNSDIASIGGVNRHGGGLIGFTNNNVLMLTTDNSTIALKKGLRDAVEFGPFLIINGKSATIKGNGGMGLANRTAIAQRKDGIVLFLVIDGRGANGSKGIDMNGMIKILERYKAYNAANLDGGGSSILVINDEVINSPKGFGYSGQRYIPNIWMVK